MLLLVVWLILRGAHVPLDRHFRNSHPRNYSSRIVDPIIFYIVTVSLSVTYFNTSERSCSSVYNVCYLTFMSSTPISESIYGNATWFSYVIIKIIGSHLKDMSRV